MANNCMGQNYYLWALCMSAAHGCVYIAERSQCIAEQIQYGWAHINSNKIKNSSSRISTRAIHLYIFIYARVIVSTYDLVFVFVSQGNPMHCRIHAASECHGLRACNLTLDRPDLIQATDSQESSCML